MILSPATNPLTEDMVNKLPVALVAINVGVCVTAVNTILSPTWIPVELPNTMALVLAAVLVNVVLCVTIVPCAIDVGCV